MSTYSKQTKHPVTGEWHEATWIDDFYGRHRYGVQFPDGEMFNADRTKLETRDDEPVTHTEKRLEKHTKEVIIEQIDICLSGQDPRYQLGRYVENLREEIIHQAIAEERARGYITHQVHEESGKTTDGKQLYWAKVSKADKL